MKTEYTEQNIHNNNKNLVIYFFLIFRLIRLINILPGYRGIFLKRKNILIPVVKN